MSVNTGKCLLLGKFLLKYLKAQGKRPTCSSFDHFYILIFFFSLNLCTITCDLPCISEKYKIEKWKYLILCQFPSLCHLYSCHLGVVPVIYSVCSITRLYCLNVSLMGKLDSLCVFVCFCHQLEMQTNVKSGSRP